jgi:hypothetical protein
LVYFYITGVTPLTTKLALHLSRDSNLILLALQFANKFNWDISPFLLASSTGRMYAPLLGLKLPE